MQKLLRWGVIGCGAVMEAKSGPAYQQTHGFELSAVMSRTLARAQDYAKRHHVAWATDDADALINHPDIDAVYIATPPDSHADYALKVAAAGKPCCIEKPLSHCYQDSLRVVEAFNHAQLPLFVAYYRRSLPRFQQVKTLLDKAAIGQLRQVCWTMAKPPGPCDLAGRYRWRTDIAVAKGGYFEDVGSHGLNLLAYLLGDIACIQGQAHNQAGMYSAADTVAANWQHQNGIIGCGSWSFACGVRRDEVIIDGSEGRIRFSVFDEAPVQLETATETQVFDIANPAPVQIHHVQAMYDSLCQGLDHVSTGASALNTDWAMDQILRSYQAVGSPS